MANGEFTVIDGFRPHQGINKFNDEQQQYFIDNYCVNLVSVPIRGSINLTTPD